ncbi:MAG: hypothetical protein HY514_00060 [Candidatus Aenigmarchaeota archaeon]|nr:hypothetical protein [Candidatus Aenigmarchaeota archaeon]
MQWRCTNCGCVHEVEEKPHVCTVCGSPHHFEVVDFSEKPKPKFRKEDME